MGRIRWIASLLGAVALVALCAPGAALAGTYSWNQPGEFSGANNPEQKYGRASWSYYSGSPGGLSPLACSGGSCTGGGVSMSGGGSLVMQAGVGSSATVGWADPFTQTQGVSIGGSIDLSAGVCGTWSLTDSSGRTLALGAVVGNTPVSAGDTLSPGSAIYLTMTGAVGCVANVSLGISTGTPIVSLTSPSNGSTFTNGEPQFSGSASTAFNASNTVGVRIYSGSSTSGSLVQTLNAAVGPSGSYSVVPSGQLSNGQYTVQASQDDPAGQTNFSAPVTFNLNVTGPGLTLNSLGSKPLLSSSPTFTGRAGTRGVDSRSVQIDIYSGSSATGAVVQHDQGSVDADGSFSVRASSPIADGRFTAVAGQTAGDTRGFSSPMTFRIKAHGPALTLSYPAKGGWNLRADVRFFGRAGTVVGDTPRVLVELWRGKKAKGKVIGKRYISVRGPTWSGTWPRGRLRNGAYTARVMQTDDAGHTTLTAPHTFSIVTAPTTIGFLVSVGKSGKATIPINCLAFPDNTCSGTVLVVTKGNFRTTTGGPAGRLRVLFAYVRMQGNQTRLVGGRVPGLVAAVLRRGKSVKVRVTTSLTWSGGMTHTNSAIRQLKIQ